MISKEELRALIDKVCFKNAKTQEAIAQELGYGKNYISEIMSPTGKITAKFLNSFNLKYANFLENPKIAPDLLANNSGKKVESGAHMASSDRILEVILSIIDTQTTILNDIRSKMAQESTQAIIDEKIDSITASLDDAKKVALLGAKYQEKKFREISDLLLRAGSERSSPSKGADNKLDEIDGGFQKPRKRR